jgi:transposase-like protein
VAALRRFFPDAAHQRCRVHYLRNALSKVAAPTQPGKLFAALRDIWAAPTRQDAKARNIDSTHTFALDRLPEHLHL